MIKKLLEERDQVSGAESFQVCIESILANVNESKIRYIKFQRKSISTPLIFIYSIEVVF